MPFLKGLDSIDEENNTDIIFNEEKNHNKCVPINEDLIETKKWISKIIPINPMYDHDNFTFSWMKNDSFLSFWYDRPIDQRIKYYGDPDFKNFVNIKKPSVSIKTESSGIDWLGISVETDKEIQKMTLDQIESVLSGSKKDIVILPDGSKCYKKSLEEIKNTAKILNDSGIEWNNTEKQNIHVSQLAKTPIMSESYLRNIISSYDKEIPSYEIDPEISSILRPYQKKGVNFLIWSCLNFKGSLIADDMGLGKTIQVLTGLSFLSKYKENKKPSLVICPLSLTHNWANEIKKFAPHFRFVVLSSGMNRSEIIKNSDDYDVIITNYSLVRMDIEELKKTDWFTIIIDEAQAIKNSNSSLCKTVKELKSEYRIAITGTPVENRISDIVSISNFMIPGYINDSKVNNDYLKAKLKPVFIRRKKTEVAPDLPERIEQNIFCEMTEKQRQIYFAEVQKARRFLENRSEISPQEMICILSEINKIRQICCDPVLAGHESDSGKSDHVFEMIPEIIEEGHKILLFSQYTRMLDIIAEKLKENKTPYFLLTGKTKSEDRQKMVSDFEEHKEPCVFLISLKAGGVGLNLVSASHVIIFDPWWNPAAESQAIDRAHRIGQKNTVIASKLIMRETIEEKVLELQLKKKKLAEDILGESSSSLTKEDLEFILS
jgi:SNF2 family DNA or RNA helicase